MLDPEKLDFEITVRKAESFFELPPEVICGIEKSVAKICAYLRFLFCAINQFPIQIWGKRNIKVDLDIHRP
jgi:hypothetical protein